MQIATKIKQLRLNKGYSQEYMALQMGISAKTYSKLENGLSRMTLERLGDISQIIEVDPFDLLSGDEQYNFYNYENSNCEIINQNNGCTENERSLYEKLIKEKETVIALLKGQLN